MLLAVNGDVGDAVAAGRDVRGRRKRWRSKLYIANHHNLPAEASGEASTIHNHVVVRCLPDRLSVYLPDLGRLHHC